MKILLALVLFSTTFGSNARMPASTVYDKAGCTGSNRSPQLHWSGAPAATHSFAIVMFDPDATGGWYHWIVYNISTAAHGLSESAPLRLSQLGRNSFGERGYGGPCPPPGKPHRYVTTLYALNVSRLAPSGMTGAELQKAIARRVIARSSLTGLYGR